MNDSHLDSTRWETETYTSTYVPYEVRCDGVSTGRYTVSYNTTSTVWTTSWGDRDE